MPDWQSVAAPVTAESPWYVARKEREGNRLIVVQGADHPLLLSSGCEVHDWHWLAAMPGAVADLGVKLRYRQTGPGARRRQLEWITRAAAICRSRSAR